MWPRSNSLVFAESDAAFELQEIIATWCWYLSPERRAGSQEVACLVVLRFSADLGGNSSESLPLHSSIKVLLLDCQRETRSELCCCLCVVPPLSSLNLNMKLCRLGSCHDVWKGDAYRWPNCYYSSKKVLFHWVVTLSTISMTSHPIIGFVWSSWSHSPLSMDTAIIIRSLFEFHLSPSARSTDYSTCVSVMACSSVIRLFLWSFGQGFLSSLNLDIRESLCCSAAAGRRIVFHLGLP